VRASLVIQRVDRTFTARRHEGVTGVMPACDSTAREDDLAGTFEGGVLKLSGNARTGCGPGGPTATPVTYVLRYDEPTDSFTGTRNGAPVWCARLPFSDERCNMPE
jgi:hypothetical protein